MVLSFSLKLYFQPIEFEKNRFGVGKSAIFFKMEDWEILASSVASGVLLAYPTTVYFQWGT